MTKRLNEALIKKTKELEKRREQDRQISAILPNNPTRYFAEDERIINDAYHILLNEYYRVRLLI